MLPRASVRGAPPAAFRHRALGSFPLSSKGGNGLGVDLARRIEPVLALEITESILGTRAHDAVHRPDIEPILVQRALQHTRLRPG